MTLQSICFPVQSIFYEVYNILKLHPPEFWSDLPPEKSCCPPTLIILHIHPLHVRVLGL